MAQFRLVFCGRNAVVMLNGAEKTVGFYATRLVVAEKEAEAVARGLADLRAELRHCAPAGAEDRSSIALETLERVPDLIGTPEPPRGFTFFPEHGGSME